jgi:hypothetical protein
MRKELLVTAVAAASLVGLSIAAADSSGAGKVRICHGTASEETPYVLIEVNANAIKDGHFKDGVGEAHGWQNMPDYIPAAGEGCEGPATTTTTASTTTSTTTTTLPDED